MIRAIATVLLVLAGCSSAPPSPAPARTCKGPSRVDYYLHADVRFTRAERDALYQAAAQWSEIACASTIIVTFDNPHPETWREDATAGRRSLVRGVELGPADIHDHDGGTTRDRMAVFVAPHERFSRLALHEFGHLLGLEHDVDGTVMRQDVSKGSDVITDRDFDQCVSKGSCDP